MATKNLTTKVTIQNLTAELKKKFNLMEIDVSKSFKSLKVDGNTVSFYTTTDKTGTAAATLDFPAEYFLDQAKTTMVNSFTWSATTYPGSTEPNPSLNGKPVLVLAVKGDGDNVTYSFLNMELLMNVYTAKVEGKDPSTKVDINGYIIDVKVNISQEDGNQLQVKPDGLYVPKPTPTDVTGKADKVAGATNGHLAALDANGNLTDSGKKPGDFVEKVLVDGVEDEVLHNSDISDFTPEEITAMLSDSTGA